jgi:hypothetical protein
MGRKMGFRVICCEPKGFGSGFVLLISCGCGRDTVNVEKSTLMRELGRSSASGGNECN